MGIKFEQLLALTGSVAMEHHGIKNREPADIDLVGSSHAVRNFCQNLGDIKSIYPTEEGKKVFALVKVLGKNQIVEAEITWNGSLSKALFELIKQDSETVFTNGLMIPSLDILYMLKMSHRYLRNSPHFKKTMDDIHCLRSRGAKIKEEYRDFYHFRKKETYNYKHPKLDVSKKDFFMGDGIKYVYDHDSIHEAVKHLSRPAYTFFKEPNSEVQCSKKLFFEAEEKIRLYAVLEEAYVLALERSQVPHRNKVNSKESFEIAMTKICSSITSGWFREFAWENWNKVFELSNMNYAENFFKLADQNLIPLHLQ